MADWIFCQSGIMESQSDLNQFEEKLNMVFYL